MTPESMQIKLKELEEQYAKLGAKLEYKLHDCRHLDCLWYGGEIAWIDFPNGWQLLVEANGEIRIDCKVDGDEVYFVDKTNSGCAFHELGGKYDDSDVDKFEYGNNNWFEVNAVSPDNKFIDLFCCDNVLTDNALDAMSDLDEYLNFAKEIYNREKEKTK